MTPGLLPGRLSSAAGAPQVPASLPRKASAERRREAEARPSISRKQACEPAPKGQGDRSVTGQGARVLRQVSLRRAHLLLFSMMSSPVASPPLAGLLPPVVFVTSLDAPWAAAPPHQSAGRTGPCVKAPPSLTRTTHFRSTWVLTR